MFSGHPNIRNALYLQPPQTHAAVFFVGFPGSFSPPTASVFEYGIQYGYSHSDCRIFSRFSSKMRFLMRL